MKERTRANKKTKNKTENIICPWQDSNPYIYGMHITIEDEALGEMKGYL